MAFARHLLADDRSGSPGGPDALELLTRRRPVVPDGSFVPLPDPVGELPYRLELDQVIGPDHADAIIRDGKLRFHALGDSGGDVDPLPQRRVAGAITRQLYGPQPARFLYHLGDLVYPHGEQDGYRSQFWVPVCRLPSADLRRARQPRCRSQGGSGPLHAGSVRRDLLLGRPAVA